MSHDSRFCHGCDSLFVNILARQTYHHLNSLELHKIYFSGSRIRRSIKQHAATLQQVVVDTVFLTDSTWYSIAQGLRKCPKLRKLYLESWLCHKHAAPPLMEALPSKYTPLEYEEQFLEDRTDIQHCLDAFVKYFRTRVCEYNAFPGRTVAGGLTLATYHELVLFHLPGMEYPSWEKPRADIALIKSAQQVEGKGKPIYWFAR